MSSDADDRSDWDSELAAPDPQARVAAIQRLAMAAAGDVSLRAAAIERLGVLVRHELSPYPANVALHALRQLAGPEPAREALLEALDSPHADVAAWAALAATDPSFARPLIDVSLRRVEPQVRCNAIRTLGRMRATEAVDPIVAALRDPLLVADAIAALGDLGDRRALPALSALRDDRRELGRVDNHGPIERVCDAAAGAIARIEANTPVDAEAPVDPNARSPAPTAETTVAVPPAAPILPPTLPRPVAGVPHESTPPPTPRRRANVWAFVPLIAVLVEVVWFAGVMFVHIVRHGTGPVSAETDRTLNALLIVPGLLGAAVGVGVIARRSARTAGEIICLVLGLIGCAYVVIVFGLGLLPT